MEAAREPMNWDIGRQLPSGRGSIASSRCRASPMISGKERINREVVMDACARTMLRVGAAVIILAVLSHSSAASDLAHPPELELVNTAEPVTVLLLVKAGVCALVTYFVWKLIPHVLGATSFASKWMWIVVCVGFERVRLIERHASNRAVSESEGSTFPKLGQYLGVAKSKPAALDMLSSHAGNLQIGSDHFELSITQSNAMSALAEGNLKCALHGGTVAHFVLRKNGGLRTNELLLVIAFDGRDSTIQVVFTARKKSEAK
jgi:hypothetical protein